MLLALTLSESERKDMLAAFEVAIRNSPSSLQAAVALVPIATRLASLEPVKIPESTADETPTTQAE